MALTMKTGVFGDVISRATGCYETPVHFYRIIRCHGVQKKVILLTLFCFMNFCLFFAIIYFRCTSGLGWLYRELEQSRKMSLGWPMILPPVTCNF